MNLIYLLDIDMNLIWLIVGVVLALAVILFLVRGFLYMGVYGMFVYPYFKIKNRKYGNVRKVGQIKIGKATDTLNKVMRENKKDFGGLYFDLRRGDKILSRTANFSYDFSNGKFVDYSVEDQKKSFVPTSFLIHGRSKEAILSDSYDDLENEKILTGKKPSKLFKKMIVDSASTSIDGYLNNTLYTDNVLYYVLGDTLFVVSRCLIPHYIYRNSDEKFVNYKTVSENLRGKESGKFFNPYIVFKKNNIIEFTNLLTKEYENIYGKELKVKEVVWCVNSSPKMNKVAMVYSDIETIYGVKGLINYLLNVDTSNVKEKHAQDFIDLMYLKYFCPSIYEGGRDSYKTNIINGKRKCYHVDNDGYSEEVGYYGSCYSECVDNTLDFVFMRHKGKAKTSYRINDVFEARKLYFSK